ncbi:MAG: hypothetical protein IPP71_23695 [Bacteroidetes bacterium]|nr:hypothetical protein [Bacteroidota bacterium]
MSKVFFVVFKFFLLTIFVSCDNTFKKTGNYYYSEIAFDSSQSNTDTLVDLNNYDSVKNFITGKEFSSKGSKMIFDDSLNVTFFFNGKEEKTFHCNIEKYILKEERLVVMSDSNESKSMRFTIAKNGMLTDINSYAQYKVRD